jgi:hypothetical protein
MRQLFTVAALCAQLVAVATDTEPKSGTPHVLKGLQLPGPLNPFSSLLETAFSFPGLQNPGAPPVGSTYRGSLVMPLIGGQSFELQVAPPAPALIQCGLRSAHHHCAHRSSPDETPASCSLGP